MPGVKKIVNKKNKSSETSIAMPPGRVMAVPPGQTKRILELDEPSLVGVTRHKAKTAAATDHQESPLRMVFEISLQMSDEFLLRDEERTPRMDERGTYSLDERGTICIDETVPVHTDLSPVTPSMDTNVVTTEEEHQLVLRSGKFTFPILSFTSAFSK
ncbi:hypothetical protein D1007_09679 [Hordeum vulgare]|nr:hypothetical protein D1007_09679 [Hordeum vulgare]